MSTFLPKILSRWQIHFINLGNPTTFLTIDYISLGGNYNPHALFIISESFHVWHIKKTWLVNT